MGAAADTGRHIPSIVSFRNLERKGKEPGFSVLTQTRRQKPETE